MSPINRYWYRGNLLVCSSKPNSRVMRVSESREDEERLDVDEATEAAQSRIDREESAGRGGDAECRERFGGGVAVAGDQRGDLAAAVKRVPTGGHQADSERPAGTRQKTPDASAAHPLSRNPSLVSPSGNIMPAPAGLQNSWAVTKPSCIGQAACHDIGRLPEHP